MDELPKYTPEDAYKAVGVLDTLIRRGESLHSKLDTSYTMKQKDSAINDFLSFLKDTTVSRILREDVGLSVQRVIDEIDSELEYGSFDTSIDYSKDVLEKLLTQFKQVRADLVKEVEKVSFPHIAKAMKERQKKGLGKILKGLGAHKLLNKKPVIIPRDEFIKEHQHLLSILKDTKDPKLQKERKSQAKELKGILKLRQ